MKYEIYQLPADHRFKFVTYDYLVMKSAPKKDDYNIVYSGEDEMDMSTSDFLEYLFYKFNENRPADYKTHSLSVSDVICLLKDNIKEWWYVNDLGFKKLEW